MRPSTLLTGVQTGVPDLVAQALLAALAVSYLVCVRRLTTRGRHVPAWRTGAFLGGLAAVWVAIGSGLAAYDDTDVTVHVIQHLLLMMVAPPLLALGRPLVVAMQVMPRRAQARTAKTFRSGPLRFVTHPGAAWSLYLGSMVVMLIDRPVYHYLIHHRPAHDASHLALIGVGLAYWEPLMGGATSGRRLSHPLRLVSVLANMPFEVMIGIWLRYQTTTLDPAVTLSDTQRAGEAFIVGAAVVSTVWLVGVVVQWGGVAVREERRAALYPATTEWSRPWWVEPAEVTGAADGP